MTPSPSVSEANNNTSMPSQQTAIVNFDEIKTLTTQNGGKKRPRIFSDAEFERRVSNIREYMDKEVKYHIIPHIPHNTKYLINQNSNITILSICKISYSRISRHVYSPRTTTSYTFQTFSTYQWVDHTD